MFYTIQKPLRCAAMLAVVISLFSSCKRLGYEAVDKPTEAQAVREPLDITPNSLKISEGEGYYGVYTSQEQWGGCPVNSAGTQRIGPGTYIRKLSESEKAHIGDSIGFRIELYAAYDEWDRDAFSWYFKVPKGTEITSAGDLDGVVRSPLIMYTTPYFSHLSDFNHITYERDISVYAQDLRDSGSDVYIMYEVGANPAALLPKGEYSFCDYPGTRADIFIDTKDEGTIANQETRIYVPLIAGRLTTGEEVKEITFDLGEDVSNALIWYTTSGHGRDNREEGRSRQHVLSVDDKEVGNFNSKVVCDPAYYQKINPHGGGGWNYPTRNWCQGGEIAPRFFEVGPLKKGQHVFKLDVGMLNDDGYSFSVNAKTEIYDGGYLNTHLLLWADKAK